MFPSPLDRLGLELRRLESLYLGSVLAFEGARDSVHAQIADAGDRATKPVQADWTHYPDHVVAGSLYELRAKYRSQYPRYLRETLFVRVISALEVFLIDTVRRVLQARKDLFPGDAPAAFAVGEILFAPSLTRLHSRLINRECRTLHSQGFTKVAEYFRNRVTIDVLAYPEYPQLLERHDRRHLLVHRLGKTDEAYRRRHSSLRKAVTVDEPYFLDTIQLVTLFTKRLDKAAAELASAPGTTATSGSAPSTIRLRLELLQVGAAAYLASDFTFFVGEDLIALRDILKSQARDGSTYDLVLAGDPAHVRAYCKLIKGLAKKTLLSILEQKLLGGVRGVGRPKIPLPMLVQLAKRLPGLPWPRGIHKQLAADLNLPRQEVFRALLYIQEQPELRSLVGSGA